MKTKVKSREENLQEQWLKYFKNIEKENDFLRILIDYYQKIIEPKLKELLESNFLEHYKVEELTNYTKDIPNEDLREYLNSIEESISFMEEDLKNECDFNKIIAPFNKHQEAFYKLEKRTKDLMPQNSQNCFTSFSIKNFKGFSKKNTIKIKPITLIYGPNSFGKSSIIQSLLLLNQTVNEGEDYRTINLLPNGNIVKLGTFCDFINNKDTKKELEIELTIPRYKYAYNKYNNHHANYINPYILNEFSFCLHFSFKNRQIVLSEIELYTKRIDYKNINNPEEKEKELLYNFKLKNNSNNLLYQVEKENYNEDHKKLSYFTLEEDYFYSRLESRFEQLENTIKNLVYVSSFRKPPERYYVPENNRRKYVGKNGEHTAEILGYDSEVNKNVNIWLEKIAGYKLSLKNNESVNSVNLDDNETKIKDINLLDLGSGIAQVLPIITQAFESENDMILIEEPEIHLHPKAQAELGEMFADAANKRGNTFIIETHSENLLLRLEKLIRKGELSKDDISVIYVDKNKNGSYCIPLELDDEGDIININEVPDGFFEEGFDELFDISKE